MSSEDFDRFRAAVLEDAALQRELLDVPQRQEFVDLVVEQARARGFDVSRADVEDAIGAGRRAWHERWV